MQKVCQQKTHEFREKLISRLRPIKEDNVSRKILILFN
jgi:hypothetical protein